MSIAETTSPQIQRPWLALALTAIAVFALALIAVGAEVALLFVIGLAMGVALYHAAFGFTGAYRRALTTGDISGVSAQLVMFAAAMVLFAPVLARGEVFGQEISGALAPVSLSMAFGAFLFGIGMQLGGSCASGTLFAAGGGGLRALLVLFFFCLGAFWGSLDLAQWQQLPGIGTISLAERWGPEVALAAQLAVLAAIYLLLRALGGRHDTSLLASLRPTWRRLLHGPWPLLWSALALAFLNWLTLIVAGHAWSITWAFSLWGAKAARLLGWDPATSTFWTGGYQEWALNHSILHDGVSVMNIGIVIGALTAASLAGKVVPRMALAWRPLAAAVIGGLAMGYGARLAYGCNIGAFFSGIASASLHGWVWIVCALPGNWVGVRLRPWFALAR